MPPSTGTAYIEGRTVKGGKPQNFDSSWGEIFIQTSDVMSAPGQMGYPVSVTSNWPSGGFLEGFFKDFPLIVGSSVQFVRVRVFGDLDDLYRAPIGDYISQIFADTVFQNIYAGGNSSSTPITELNILVGDATGSAFYSNISNGRAFMRIDASGMGVCPSSY